MANRIIDERMIADIIKIIHTAIHPTICLGELAQFVNTLQKLPVHQEPIPISDAEKQPE